jgi:hypothetical protein
MRSFLPSRASRVHISLLTLALTAAFAASATAQITPGNLVVVRVGAGAAPLSNASQAVFLDEYTPTGTLVQTLPMPTAASGANRPLTNSGTATSEGFLQLSADGRYLVSAGYGTPPGTASVASSATAVVNRVVARTALDGTIDTSTAITDALSGNNIRSATSDDGSRFWVAGANDGIRFIALGASTSVGLNTTAPTNNRVVGIANGQLYATAATGAFRGVSAVGTGLPTTAGQTITLLPGFPTVAGPSSYDFFFASPSTLYVADDRTIGGGIEKWTESGGTWTLQYTLAPGTGVGCRGLTGAVAGGIASLWATTTSSEIVRVTDVGAASPFMLVAVSQPDTVFRGIRRVPGGGRFTRVPHGCGSTTIQVTGQPVVGGNVSIVLGGLTGTPVIGIGFLPVNLQFCGCTLGHDWLTSRASATLNANLPPDPGAIGLSFFAQGAELFSTGGCPFPQISLSDTFLVTLGG